MQSYASAAKLRGGRPILNRGVKAIPRFGSPPPRIVIGSNYAPTRSSRNCLSILLLDVEPVRPAEAGRQPGLRQF